MVNCMVHINCKVHVPFSIPRASLPGVSDFFHLGGSNVDLKNFCEKDIDSVILYNCAL